MVVAVQSAGGGVSVNALAAPLVAELVAGAARLRLGVTRSEQGAIIVDAGIAVRGGLEAGRRIAEICMGGLGTVALAPGNGEPGGFLQVHVHSADPVIACLASQYAGWSLAHGEGKGAFQALASGPGTGDRPSRAAVRGAGVRGCGRPRRVRARGGSGAAGANHRQDRARLRAAGGAHHPRPDADAKPRRNGADRRPHAGGRAAQGARARLRARSRSWTAPASRRCRRRRRIFSRRWAAPTTRSCSPGARRCTWTSPTPPREQLARTLPASASRDYGRPFAQVFKDYGFDFYKIDPMLFAPAEVTVCNLASGQTFRGGKRDLDRLAESFGS